MSENKQKKTMVKKQRAKRAPKKPFNYLPYLIVTTLVALVLMGYISHRLVLIQDWKILVAQLAVFAGVLYESIRLSDKKLDVLYRLLGIFFFALFVSAIPGRREIVYNYDQHLIIFSYMLLLFYTILSVCENAEKVVKKLTEGITLFQSIAFIYWVMDLGYFNIENNYIRVLIGVGLLLSFFSLFQAFTLVNLTVANRFILSVWSSVIMLIFSVDYLRIIYNENGSILSTSTAYPIWVSVLQYFLLGVSSMYIVHNVFMIIALLPDKHKSYGKVIREAITEHVNRYSDKQVNRLSALLCIIFATGFFVVNYYYRYLPRNTAIWLAFVMFPIILNMFSSIKGYINNEVATT